MNARGGAREPFQNEDRASMDYEFDISFVIPTRGSAVEQWKQQKTGLLTMLRNWELSSRIRTSCGASSGACWEWVVLNFLLTNSVEN